MIPTERQCLEIQIENDRRNVADLRVWLDEADRAKVIADCACRLFQTRDFDRELERRAEHNLREALRGWRAE